MKSRITKATLSYTTSKDDAIKYLCSLAAQKITNDESWLEISKDGRLWRIALVVMSESWDSSGALRHAAIYMSSRLNRLFDLVCSTERLVKSIHPKEAGVVYEPWPELDNVEDALRAL